MKRLISIITCLVAFAAANAQYKNDNVLYKTIYWENVCAEIKSNPGCLILDVRSPGEFDDTSSYKVYNLGHLKGAVNISIQELGQRMSEIEEYKDKTVFVYCSHSQRSRRSSKMLADSGFKYVYNINGGITDLYMDNKLVHSKCLKELVKSRHRYQFISVSAFCKTIADNESAFVLDVRSDAAWQHKDTNARANAFGFFKKAVHIQLADLYNNLSVLPKDQPILLVDIDGDQAIEAAEFLEEKGFKNISVLMDGIARWYASDDKQNMCTPETFVRAAPYNIVSVRDFIGQMQNRTPYVLVDVRSAQEFGNTADPKWKNMGHVKTAINIPAADIMSRIGELADYTNKPVLLYAGGGNNAELYTAADSLSANGFKNVYVLSRGIFDIRWTAANIKGMDYLFNWVVDVPE